MRPIGTGRTAVSHLCSLVAHECSFRNDVGAIITLIRALLNVIQHAYRIAFYHATHVVEITHSAITFTKACLHVKCRMMYACTPAESRSETIRANFVCLGAVQTSRRHIALAEGMVTVVKNDGLRIQQYLTTSNGEIKVTCPVSRLSLRQFQC